MTKIPTTFEMDGLLTQEDIDRRFIVWVQCFNCQKWTRYDDTDDQDKIMHNRVCEHCGSSSMDIRSTCSDRTYDPHNKRKARRK